jgi:high-affinity iron transporter
MLAAALIVFREVLEAALIVSIVMAASRGVPHRGKWISLGLIGGVLGAGAVAAMTNFLSSLFEGAGQDIVNAVILFIAVALIGWHVVWMNSHGRKMAADMRAVGKSVADGERHLSILAIVVSLAVLREGSEVVLMLQGLWSSGSTLAMLGGSALGLAAGALAGIMLYAGFLVLSVQRMFSLTNGLLVLIAAGMAARGANFLAQAGLIPSLGGRMWDTSAILSDQSIPGQLLAALVGYIARPNGIEVLVYSLTVLVVVGLMCRPHRRTFSIKPFDMGAKHEA